MRVTSVARVITALLLVATLASAGDKKKKEVPSPIPVEHAEAIDRAIQRERALVMSMRKLHPMVETYYQSVAPDRELGLVPVNDKYFLGRLDLDQNFDERFYMEVSTSWYKRLTHPLRSFYTIDFMPEGFSNMIFLDRTGFDRQHYRFEYLGREFIGQVRCQVFQVSPLKLERGRFLGRIWVEDQDFNIVRFNGVYTHASGGSYYFHMDSWRSNVRGNEWLPSHVYSEESDVRYAFGMRSLRFKAQTKLWGYGPRHSGLSSSEHTDVTVDSTGKVRDDAPSGDVSPVDSLRAWQREAEDNVLNRMELAGLLAKRGELEKVLETVVTNLMVTNELEIQPEVRCRVLLTSPLESFTVGHTIVVSRGLLDVLPDESSLAMVLSHELAHIALGHQLDTKYGFGDHVIFRDEQSFNEMNFRQDEQHEEQADRKAIELLRNSPYADKLASAGLFLRALQDRAASMPALLDAQLGNSLAGNHMVRMAELMNKAPQLQPRAVDQIAALPLGARIKVDLWDDRTEMSKAKSTPLLSAREKMPFEVTPYIPNLTRATNSAAGTSERGAVGNEELPVDYTRVSLRGGN